VKNLHGDMRLFKNENYTDFYTEPPVLSLEDVLYVEVNMERPLVSDIDSSSNVSSNASNHTKMSIFAYANTYTKFLMTVVAHFFDFLNLPAG